MCGLRTGGGEKPEDVGWECPVVVRHRELLGAHPHKRGKSLEDTRKADGVEGRGRLRDHRHGGGGRNMGGDRGGGGRGAGGGCPLRLRPWGARPPARDDLTSKRAGGGLGLGVDGTRSGLGDLAEDRLTIIFVFDDGAIGGTDDLDAKHEWVRVFDLNDPELPTALLGEVVERNVDELREALLPGEVRAESLEGFRPSVIARACVSPIDDESDDLEGGVFTETLEVLGDDLVGVGGSSNLVAFVVDLQSAHHPNPEPRRGERIHESLVLACGGVGDLVDEGGNTEGVDLLEVGESVRTNVLRRDRCGHDCHGRSGGGGGLSSRFIDGCLARATRGSHRGELTFFDIRPGTGGFDDGSRGGKGIKSGGFGH